MGLREYQRKRDFSRTPEPAGQARPGGPGHRFCVQKHAASRLHYDFRLELDGFLKSWAVPKGPSLDPADKRLAMETEDHPLEYVDFEGIIPQGQYGGGTVLLWDQGTWEPLDDAREAYAKGRLKFRLHGDKLRGGWTLVRIRGRDPRDRGKSWLLIKERDETARPAAEQRIADARPESVLTGRSMEEIARAQDRVWESSEEEPAPARRRTQPRPPPPDAAAVPGARPGALPRFVAPALATLVRVAPDGDEWLHEIKFDGYRIQCRIEGGDVALTSRSAKDWTGAFPAVVRGARGLRCRQALIDGEVAVVQADGTTSFNALQNAMQGGPQGRLACFAFDLLHLDGFDLRGARLEDRKAALRALLAAAGAEAQPFLFSEHVVGSGQRYFAQACRMKLEGVVSKRRAEPYRGGRGRDWLKVKCLRAQEFVVGGFTEPRGQRAGLGALLLGVHDGGRLRYAGKVGTGFTDRAARELRRRLDALAAPSPPFDPRPAGARGARWVEPALVAQVAFTEWTPDGKLRHPTYLGLREDKPPGDVVREEPIPTEPARRARRGATSASAPRPGRRRSGPS